MITSLESDLSIHSAKVVGGLLASISALSCLWSCLAIFSSRKLRKPIWIFRLSASIKDILLCVIALLPNLTTSSEVPQSYELYLSGCVIACISSSVFTLLCASIDRYHAATRPFRYHIGDLMPVGVAITLLLNCWTIAVIVAIAVISDYNQTKRYSYGILLHYVSMERWQKGLLLSGLTIAYVTAGILLTKAEFSVAKQKRESRLRLETGREEPLHSRKNSASDDPHRDNPTLIGSDPEMEANQMLYQIEEPTIEMKRTKRKWSLKLTQTVGFFTPPTYRPSILRRIRDTWYLNAVLITWSVSFFTTILPIFYFVISGENCTTSGGKSEVPILGITSNTTITTTGAIQLSSDAEIHCVMGIIFDCLILSHGLICSIVYVLIDDVFRPRCLFPITMLLSPIRCLQNRRGSDSTGYSVGRRRTSSKNSNIMTHSV